MTAILETFRQELISQIIILNEGLLAFEANPENQEILVQLMRSTHSLKGASRMVELIPLVTLLHKIENCFVALQERKINLNRDLIDHLFNIVDFLHDFSEIEVEKMYHWLEDRQSRISELQHNITVENDSSESALMVGESTSLKASPSGSLVSNTYQNVERVVRVSADNLNRIMGLAGESVVEANWLKPFADSLTLLKTRHLALSKTIEELKIALNKYPFAPELQSSINTLHRQEEQCRDLLTEQLDIFELYIRRTSNLSDRLYREVISSNMRPFADGIEGFGRMIRDLSHQCKKQVKFEVVGKATAVDRDILSKLESPLTHLIRNAIDHGIESVEERISQGKPPEGTIRIEAGHRGGMLALTVSDDGQGVKVDRIQEKAIARNLITPEFIDQLSLAEWYEFLFLPNFSTSDQVTDLSGRGVGLDVVKSMVQEVGGTIRISSQLGKGTSFHFQLPLTLSVVRTLLVDIAGEPYAFPLARIDRIVALNPDDLQSMEGRNYFIQDGENIGLLPAYRLLELPETVITEDRISVVVLGDQNNSYGLVVDRFLGEQDLVVRPLDPRLGKLKDISAVALLSDGSPVLIIDVADLLQSIETFLQRGQVQPLSLKTPETPSPTAKKILVVDDSATVRETERSLLQRKGYQVEIAGNGIEGWTALCNNHYDLVISDIDMPLMNGIELVKQVKSHPQLQHTPIIIVSYRDQEFDRIKGLEAGADYFLTKSSFQDDTLVQAVIDLIGYPDP